MISTRLQRKVNWSDLTFIFILLFLFITSCALDKNDRHIDLEESEQIIGFMDSLKIKTLARISEENIIINDTLIVFDTLESDSLTKAYAPKPSVRIEDWPQQSPIGRETLISLRDLMKASHNIEITHEGNSYFFSEGGWIDSESGKAFSRESVSVRQDMKSLFKFEKVNEITPISERANWYEYYAD